MRRTPLQPGDKPLRRRVPLTARLGLRRTAPRERGGSLAPSNSITNPHGVADRKPRQDTGPDELTRALILERDNLTCAACGTSIIGQPYSRQHRVPRSMGGRSKDHPWVNSPTNLILLCGSSTSPGCHLKCEQRDPEMHDRGFWITESDFTADPGEVPLLIADLSLPGFTLMWLTPDGQRVTEQPDWDEVTW